MIPPNSQKTILFVEDEEQLRSPILALLQKSGYNIIVAVDGLEALSKARDHNGEIHLLLSDIQLTQMTGIELATQLLIKRPRTGILLMSGTDFERLVLDHGWQFLSKPFGFQILKRTIESMLNNKLEPGRDPSDGSRQMRSEPPCRFLAVKPHAVSEASQREKVECENSHWA